jgi:phosphatidylinositol 3-kinase
MAARRAWNQWIELPVMFCDLPGDALLCLTVYDCTGPGVKEAVGGTSISLFGKKGVLRTGMMVLVVWAGQEGGAATLCKVVNTDKEPGRRAAARR